MVRFGHKSFLICLVFCFTFMVLCCLCVIVEATDCPHGTGKSLNTVNRL